MNEFLALVQNLQLAIKALLMYTAAHPRGQAALAGVLEAVERWLAEKPSIHIAASQGKMFLDGKAVEATSIHLTNLCKQLVERQINGFVLSRGVDRDELAALLDLLILKPARIEEMGGAAAVMAARNTPHIQLSQTQYREVREGEGGQDEGAPGSLSSEQALAEAIKSLAKGLEGGPESGGPGADFDLEILTDEWEQELDSLPHASLLEEGGVAPADLGFLAHSILASTFGEGFPGAAQVEALRGALLGLEPETLLSVVAGMDSLPPSPAGMRQAFQALAGESFAKAAAALMAGDLPWEQVGAALHEVLRNAPQRASMLAALEAELKALGAGPEALERLKDLLQQMEWENQTMEEKIRLALHHGHLWTITHEQRLSFLRRLLDEGRIEAFLTILERLLEALAHEDATRREPAARTLAGVCLWMVDPGLPIEAEGPLFQGLTAHFAWEPLIPIHQATVDALEAALGSLVVRGEPGQALNLMGDLRGLCAFQEDSRQPWRDQALEHLWARLSDRAALDRVIELLHTANPESMMTELIPYLEEVGEEAAEALVAKLGEEPDRKRRGRLIEAIRGMGPLALPAVHRGLESPAWFLVRNTLNLLADMGDAAALGPAEGCLSHPDGRVRRAAVRTLWKVGGLAAVASLLAALPSTDPETQQEIVFGLGQVKSVQAIPAVAAVAQDKRAPERLRARAAETLGHIGDPSAAPALTELARRRGLIFSTAEPTSVRLAACRSLQALGTPQALEALRDIVRAEPANKDRDLLRQILDHTH